MATHDRIRLQPVAETVANEREPQGELFARLMLRQLPIMKSGPEDLLNDARPTLH